MSNPIDELSEQSKVGTFVCGAMHRLIEMGYISGRADRVPPVILSVFDQLEASGYRPERAQLAAYVSTRVTYPEGMLDHLLFLLSAWDDLKDRPLRRSLTHRVGKWLEDNDYWLGYVWRAYFALSNLLLAYIIYKNWN